MPIAYAVVRGPVVCVLRLAVERMAMMIRRDIFGTMMVVWQRRGMFFSAVVSVAATADMAKAKRLPKHYQEGQEDLPNIRESCHHLACNIT